MASHSSGGAGPLLSMILIGRNDSYMGNFRYRLTTAINFLARGLAAIGRLDDVEILVTDWNSPQPLADAVPLTPDAARVCRFLVVRPEIAQAALAPGEVFNGACATNVALRRAGGRYLMLYDADSLTLPHSLRSLLDLLDGRLRLPVDVEHAYFYCGRHQIPWEIAQRQPTLQEWERYLVLHSGQLPPDSRSYGLGIFGIGLMMHRALWLACRGYDESMHGWGWVDADLILRVTQRQPWIDLASIGMTVFHMEHSARDAGRRAGGARTGGGHATNPYQVRLEYAANDADWGLGQADIAPQPARAGGADASASAIAAPPAWDLTRAQATAEMIDPLVRRHVRRHTTSPRVKPTEWGSLHALAWHSLRRYPRSYLEFGIRDPYAAVIVAATCPGVEIYGIDSWARDGSQPTPPPSYITSLLEGVGYRGYARYVSGDVSTAFDRLQQSFVGPCQFDLAFVRGDLLGADAAARLRDVAARLAPGGALVFTASSRSAFDAAWDAFAAGAGAGADADARAPLTLWQCRARHTGVAVAAALAGEAGADEEARLAAAWRAIAFSRGRLLIWRRRAQSIWSQLRGQSPRQWPATLRARWTLFRARWRLKP
jgi:hypothetical protein